VKNYTDDELVELIDRSLKQTAKDVREGRVPLDGRARLPLPSTPIDVEKSTVPHAAE
jgi:hypothetical protein